MVILHSSSQRLTKFLFSDTPGLHSCSEITANSLQPNGSGSHGPNCLHLQSATTTCFDVELCHTHPIRSRQRNLGAIL